ncbi:acetylornithine deacetylase [bacterium]|nr:acetylornithine deacetylase [bacterium]
MPDLLTPLEILTRLVAFPTVSRDSNLDLIDWLEAYLTGHGLKTARHWNEDRRKAALMAHAGPWQAGGVVLSGHSDVVPVDGQVWTSDPFTVTARDGRLYGRGTCDMKGFVALAVWALVEAHRRGLARPLQLALSYDEEIGCTGAEPLLSTLVTEFPKASLAIIGEPSRMQPIDGHKGGTGFKVHVKGYEVHSSLLPQGVSAIMEGARLIAWVNAQNEAQQGKVPSDLAARFDPPFTTLHVGMISGGTAHNITAADCNFAVEMRVMPGEEVEDWAARFEAAAAALDRSLSARRPEAGVHLDRFFRVPPLVPEVGGAAETLVRRLTNAGPGGAVSYGTEAGFFQARGYSTVVCGPGDIAQAHQADEYLEESQFQAGLDFMSRLLEDLS